MSDLIPAQSFDLSPKSLEEALTFADYLSKSSIVPKDFQDKPGNILVAIQWGMELGLKPMQAMQNIAVINGRPSLWGDAVLALVRASPVCEYVYESNENGTAICRVKRRGEEEQFRTFSDADAKQAGLIGKQGPWAQYPQRMKQMRARAFALRDVFPDVLKGMPIAEEVGDYLPAEKDITPRNKQTPTQIAQAAQQTAQIARTDKHEFIIADLELIAKEGGPEPLAKAWQGLTKEDRKAIGTDELNRLKAMAGAEDVTPNEGENHE
ncbi:recombinase RecT [Caballeronia sp. LZ035]|uniref:recombinase RecT n=1 Tax=Caballeronia sp. LZ035 TaxID=3038568 RepID=UPI00285EE3CB|nr:recombinase RecT [Caballeronia sp. LZ035]MDR5756990.1 hypothetical protein [Caballeronia sp. LZ035]